MCQHDQVLVQLFAWLADGHLLVCAHMTFPWFVFMENKGEISLSFSSYEPTSPIGLNPTFMSSFNLNNLLKPLSPNTVTLEIRHQPMNLGETLLGP